MQTIISESLKPSLPSNCLFNCGDDKSQATLQALKDNSLSLSASKSNIKFNRNNQLKLLELGPNRLEKQAKEVKLYKHQKKISIKDMLSTLEVNKLGKRNSNKSSLIQTDNEIKPRKSTPATFLQHFEQKQFNFESHGQRIKGKENNSNLRHQKSFSKILFQKKNSQKKEISQGIDNSNWGSGIYKKQADGYLFQPNPNQAFQTPSKNNRKLLKLGQDLPTLRSFEAKTLRINAEEKEILFW